MSIRLTATIHANPTDHKVMAGLQLDGSSKSNINQSLRSLNWVLPTLRYSSQFPTSILAA